MNRMNWETVKVFTKIGTKRFFRDRLAIFFVIVFPLIFLFVFGGINSSGDGLSFTVALQNKSDTEFAKQFETQLRESDVFEIDEASTQEAIDEKLTRSQIDAVVILPEGFGSVSEDYPSGEAVVRYSQGSEQQGQIIISVIEGIFDQTNSELLGTEPPLTVSGNVSNEQGLSAFDYSFAGLLGFSIIGLGIFGPVNVFPELKKQGVLRRFHTTPLSVKEYFAASVLSQAVIGLVAVAIMFLVALVMYGLEITGNIFEVAIFITLSIIMIYGIGLAIGGWAKNERQAAPLGNIIVFPMMFLSGTFFPRFLMPEFMQVISNFLPLTPVIDGIRLVLNEGQSLVDISGYIFQIIAWTIVVYWIAFRVFRWE